MLLDLSGFGTRPIWLLSSCFQTLYPAAFSILSGDGRAIQGSFGLQIRGLPLAWIPASSEPLDTQTKAPCVRASPPVKDLETNFRHLALCALSMVETSIFALLSVFTPFSGASSYFSGFFVITLDRMGGVQIPVTANNSLMTRDTHGGVGMDVDER